MKKKTYKIIDTSLKIMAGISVVVIIVIYLIVVTRWSDADYCKRGISIETTCN